MDPVTNLKRQDYRGILFAAKVVENTGDPKGAGQIKVRIPGLFDGISDEDLPWASPYRFVNSVVIPQKGQKVYVEFDQGDPHHPIYFADVAGTNSVTNSPFGGEVPFAWGFYDGAGNFLKFNQSTKDVILKSGDGSNIEMDGSGNVIETAAKDLSLISNAGNINITATSGNLVLNITGNVTMTVTGNLLANVTGTTVITSGGAATISAPTINLI